MGVQSSRLESTTNKKAKQKPVPTQHRGDPSERCALQNFLLVWVDLKIETKSRKNQQTLEKVRSIVNDVTVFTETASCIEFLREISKEKVFVVVSERLGRELVPQIHAMAQLDTIYISSDNRARCEKWTREWRKIKGVYGRSRQICDALRVAVKHCNQDSIPVSFAQLYEGNYGRNLNELEPSFMYTQLFKGILLDVEYSEQAVKDLVTYCRAKAVNFASELEVIDEYERSYQANQAIWWYTRECFLYQMLNRALRLLEGDIIVNMAFFIRDLHRQIEQLHKEQVTQYHGKKFTVYRGQGLSVNDFEKLKHTQGGLMSFNSFLSTSKNRNVSIGFAEQSSRKLNTVGILFIMNIDPAITSAPFAIIDQHSYFKMEAEVLFSTHTVFRIGDIRNIKKGAQLFEVNLTFTVDDDEQLRALTNRLDKEVHGTTGSQRMMQLLIRLGQLDKAKELNCTLLKLTAQNSGDAHYYNHQQGYIAHQQGNYEEAIKFYEKALEIQEKTLPATHSSLAISYNNIAGVYVDMAAYSKGLTFYQKTREIFEATLNADDPSLATLYNNLGLVHEHMGDYLQALSSYERALDIRQKTLPVNHPDIAQSNNSIGGVHMKMGEYAKALSCYQTGLRISQKTLPTNHPDMATSYNNLGSVHMRMGEHSKALAVYQIALDIYRATVPENHPNLATSYGNIGLAYSNMADHAKALFFYEKTREIYEKTLSENHPSLATLYNNIGLVHKNMAQYPEALSLYEKALAIRQKSVHANHPDMAQSYDSLGGVYMAMGESSKALSFYERALDIKRKSLPADHPTLATSYNNMAWVYTDIKDSAKALGLFRQALDIQERILPSDHPRLQETRENIEMVRKKTLK